MLYVANITPRALYYFADTLSLVNCNKQKKKCEGYPCSNCAKMYRKCIYPDAKPGRYKSANKIRNRVEDPGGYQTQGQQDGPNGFDYWMGVPDPSTLPDIIPEQTLGLASAIPSRSDTPNMPLTIDLQFRDSTKTLHPIRPPHLSPSPEMGSPRHSSQISPNELPHNPHSPPIVLPHNASMVGAKSLFPTLSVASNQPSPTAEIEPTGNEPKKSDIYPPSPALTVDTTYADQQGISNSSPPSRRASVDVQREERTNPKGLGDSCHIEQKGLKDTREFDIFNLDGFVPLSSTRTVDTTHVEQQRISNSSPPTPSTLAEATPVEQQEMSNSSPSSSKITVDPRQEEPTYPEMPGIESLEGLEDLESLEDFDSFFKLSSTWAADTAYIEQQGIVDSGPQSPNTIADAQKEKPTNVELIDIGGLEGLEESEGLEWLEGLEDLSAFFPPDSTLTVDSSHVEQEDSTDAQAFDIMGDVDTFFPLSSIPTAEMSNVQQTETICDSNTSSSPIAQDVPSGIVSGKLKRPHGVAFPPSPPQDLASSPDTRGGMMKPDVGSVAALEKPTDNAPAAASVLTDNGPGKTKPSPVIDLSMDDTVFSSADGNLENSSLDKTKREGRDDADPFDGNLNNSKLGELLSQGKPHPNADAYWQAIAEKQSEERESKRDKDKEKAIQVSYKEWVRYVFTVFPNKNDKKK
jgi:hypothetical protein